MRIVGSSVFGAWPIPGLNVRISWPLLLRFWPPPTFWKCVTELLEYSFKVKKNYILFATFFMQKNVSLKVQLPCSAPQNKHHMEPRSGHREKKIYISRPRFTTLSAQNAIMWKAGLLCWLSVYTLLISCERFNQNVQTNCILCARNGIWSAQCSKTWARNIDFFSPWPLWGSVLSPTKLQK